MLRKLEWKRRNNKIKQGLFLLADIMRNKIACSIWDRTTFSNLSWWKVIPESPPLLSQNLHYDNLAGNQVLMGVVSINGEMLICSVKTFLAKVLVRGIIVKSLYIFFFFPPWVSNAVKFFYPPPLFLFELDIYFFLPRLGNVRWVQRYTCNNNNKKNAFRFLIGFSLQWKLKV